MLSRRKNYLHEYNDMLFSVKMPFRVGGPLVTEEKQSILKSRDLAILLDLSPDVVNDMARRGHLKGFKSGNQWRFRRRDVERYIERMRKLTPPG